MGRTDIPGADWETLLDSIRRARRPAARRDRGVPGARAGDDARRRARVATRSSPSCGSGRPTRPDERPLSDRAAARDPRRRAGRDAALAVGHRRDRRVSAGSTATGRSSRPVFEDTALFARTSGAGSDVVQKEMYTFEDRSNRSLTLRPEGTAPICRAYVEHGMHRDPQPVKLFTIAPMYRYGAPGRGRYREHWQASVEALGSDDPAIDAELIQLYDTLLARLGVTRYHLELNSIGCRDVPARVPRGARGLARRERRPARRGHAREGRRQPAARLRQLPREAARGARRAGRGAEDRRVAVRGVRRALRRRPGAPRRHWASTTASCPTLVRGLDYYTRTTFEFVGPLENQNSTITGGGRYDYLVEEIGGPPTPGIGFGAGIERLVIALEEEGVEEPPAPAIDVFLARRARRAARPRRGVARGAAPRRASPPRPTTRAARSRAS